MRLGYGVLCEHALLDRGLKATVVSIVETLTMPRDPTGPFLMMPLFVAARIIADVTDPLEVPVVIRLVDEDMHEIMAWPMGLASLKLAYPGQPRSCNIQIRLVDAMLPGAGHFTFQLCAADVVLGSMPLYVRVDP